MKKILPFILFVFLCSTSFAQLSHVRGWSGSITVTITGHIQEGNETRDFSLKLSGNLTLNDELPSAGAPSIIWPNGIPTANNFAALTTPWNAVVDFSLKRVNTGDAFEAGTWNSSFHSASFPLAASIALTTTDPLKVSVVDSRQYNTTAGIPMQLEVTTTDDSGTHGDIIHMPPITIESTVQSAASDSGLSGTRSWTTEGGYHVTFTWNYTAQ